MPLNGCSELNGLYQMSPVSLGPNRLLPNSSHSAEINFSVSFRLVSLLASRLAFRLAAFSTSQSGRGVSDESACDVCYSTPSIRLRRAARRVAQCGFQLRLSHFD